MPLPPPVHQSHDLTDSPALLSTNQAFSSQPGQTLQGLDNAWNPPAPLSHLCPACKLWPCGEQVCVCVCVWCVYGWLDCYIHYSGLLTLLVIIHTCLLETVKRKVAFRRVKSSDAVDLQYERRQEEAGWRFPSIPGPQLRFFPVCQRGMWSHIAMGQRGRFTVVSSSLHFLITVLQCNPIHKSKYMNIPVYSIICFLSMWSYGEDVDLTLYLGHRSLCKGRYAFAHNSV